MVLLRFFLFSLSAFAPLVGAFSFNGMRQQTSQGPPPVQSIESGIIEYIGNTKLENRIDGMPRWHTDQGSTYRNISSGEKFLQSFALWFQPPWKKIKGKIILNIKLGGSLSLESSSMGGGLLGNIGKAPPDPSSVTSLSDFQTLMSYAAHDPRVLAVTLQIDGFQCGYAKLQEARRSIKYFLQSGKKITAYADAASEKEVYVALACSEFFVPPDGSIDLRGFAG